MRQMPQKGWCVFARSARSELPLPHTFRYLKREARQAWLDEMLSFGMSYDAATELWAERVFDGSYRIGKCELKAIAEGGDA